MGNVGRGPCAQGSRPFGCRLSSRGVNASQALDLPLLGEGLDRLEPLLTSTVVTGDGFLDSVTTHLIAAGGKQSVHHGSGGRHGPRALLFRRTTCMDFANRGHQMSNGRAAKGVGDEHVMCARQRCQPRLYGGQ